MTDTSKSKLELITDLLKATSWPLIIIIVIIVFWKPIKMLIGNSESITIGSLTVKLKNDIPTPSQSVKDVISNMSSKEIQELLFLGNDTLAYTGYNVYSLEEAPINRMMDLKLITRAEFVRDTTKKYFKVTKLGSDTYDFYTNLIGALGKQIDNAEKK